ncbi:TIGR03619 family F420-dependent LLM class oxidoreductase [Amycolatopsis anabasis]|uniref:TIGR03619 family F420-dependent LLM class oxidoreductase n=1 Tax=Amycolatopsis anabasis TaxID=1840409 RepID=UPI00131C31BD|nr:TIGR03619 family F420-dependent LLM class oxidoreductase [Amycolatopsis anabasis]
MRIGLGLPHFGPLADPGGIGRFAAAAEELGYASLWTGDRVLTPVAPSDLYPGGGTPERPYPPEFTRFFDPLVALTVAATATTSIRLGTSTLTATLYPPVLLGRTLTSLDVLSGGRLDVGLGIGWLRDEYTAAGVPWAGRGKRLEEILDVLTALWTADPVQHDGPRWRIPPSTMDLRPVRRPHPPVLLGGFSHAALERVGRRADGWLPGRMPPETLGKLWDIARSAAERAGRDPDSLRRVLRLNPRRGTALSQLADQFAEAEAAGVEEAFADLHYVADSIDHALDLAAGLRALIA